MKITLAHKIFQVIMNLRKYKAYKTRDVHLSPKMVIQNSPSIWYAHFVKKSTRRTAQHTICNLIQWWQYYRHIAYLQILFCYKYTFLFLPKVLFVLINENIHQAAWRQKYLLHIILNIINCSRQLHSNLTYYISTHIYDNIRITTSTWLTI